MGNRRFLILFLAVAITLPYSLHAGVPKIARAATDASSVALGAAEVRIDTNAAGAEDNPDYTQAIASDDHGNVFIAYVDDRAGLTLFFNRSTDFGATFGGTDQRIDRTGLALAGAVVSVTPPRICTDGKGAVFVAFQDSREFEPRLFFTVSRDYGVTWSQAARISSSTSSVSSGILSTALTCDHKGNVYAVYQDEVAAKDDVFFTRSTDYGSIWSSPMRMDTDATPGAIDTLSPTIAADGSGRVVVAYQDERTAASKHDIFVRTSSDYGLSFGSEVRVDTQAGPGGTFDGIPVIGTDQWGRMYIVWSSGSAIAATLDIFFSRSTDGGVTWSSPVQLNGTNSGLGAAGASVVADASGLVVVAYHDVKAGGPGTADTYIARSTDFGATFSAEKRVNTSGLLSGSTSPFGFPHIALDRFGNVVVAYSDDRTAPFDNNVFYNYSEDSGATWQSSDIRISTGSVAGRDSLGVRIAMDDRGRAYFVYSSDRTGPGADVFSRVAKFTLNDRFFDREGGTNRYDTGAKISKDLFADRSRDALVIASGENFPDGIVGGPLANLIDGPLLLTRSTGMPSETAAEIIRVFDSVDDPETDVYVLGGLSAISATVKTTITQLDPDIDFEVVAGANRVKTALEVAKKIDALRGSDPSQAFVAFSGNFPDALGASGVAGSRTVNKKIIPVLLNPTTPLDADVDAYLRSKSATLKTVDMIGGTTVLTDSVFASIDAIIDVVNRRSGSNRFSTATAVDTAFRAGALSPLGVSIANGLNFPDALTGGVHAAYLDYAIVLVNPTSVPPESRDYLSFPANAATLGAGHVYGGVNAVSDGVKAIAEGLI